MSSSEKMQTQSLTNWIWAYKALTLVGLYIIWHFAQNLLSEHVSNTHLAKKNHLYRAPPGGISALYS